MKLVNQISLVVFALVLMSCSESDSGTDYSPTAADIQTPEVFNLLLPPPFIPTTNPLTKEGIELGRKLFYEPLLSEDGTQSCANCHLSNNAFTDPDRYSTGIDGSVGNRNAMPLFNFAWNYGNQFLWDGRAASLEEQVSDPILSEIEMKNTWSNIETTLNNTNEYPDLFFQAFGTSIIDSTLVVKAIAQFERTLISGNSRFDRHLLGENILTESELNGFDIFMDEARGDCFHCHGSDANPLWTDNEFHNNGLDSSFEDLGLGNVTNDPLDNGKFKSPSLRNLAYTAPYMHDGRFETLEEVINHYSEGLVFSETIDPLMKNITEGGAYLTEDDKLDLKAFLLSLSEPGFTTNPDFQNPN